LDRSVQRRIHDARFPIVKTMAGWDWNWPAKINRNLRSLRLSYLFENAVPAAKQAARDGHGHLHYLQENAGSRRRSGRPKSPRSNR
jgi:hypothetical protein